MLTRREFVTLCCFSPTLLSLGSCTAARKLSLRSEDNYLYSFLFCNDIHITTEEHELYFAASIDKWNSFSDYYDFIVVCGDMVNDGKKEEFIRCKRQLDRLQKPYYPVIGNHDITVGSKNEKDAYRSTFGENRENYVVMHNGTVLLFLDLTESTRAQVRISKGILSWVESTIRTISVTAPMIVFSHFPLHPEAPAYSVTNAPALLNLLDTHKVLAFLSGHYHGRWQKERNGVVYFGNACLSLKRNNHDNSPEEGYMLVKVYASYVEARFFERGST